MIFVLFCFRNLSNTRVTSIPAEAFVKYAAIQELYIRNATALSVIERNAFVGLPQLRILMIIDCVKLTTIGSGVFGTFQNLHTLRILKSGLATLPNFSRFETRSQTHNKSMYEIDLTTNRIRRIHRGAFRGVRTWLLRLENNMLREIQDYAFNGSQIFNLDFQNNPDLHSLGEHAFSGISDLQSLNLSKTSIWHLPTDGLINIKELNVEDVPSLKQFPSVFKFSHIDVARLTYPHHCCAFQHPEKQDPVEYQDYEQERQRKQQILQQQQGSGSGTCGAARTSSSPTHSTRSESMVTVSESFGFSSSPAGEFYGDARHRRDSDSGHFGDIVTANPNRPAAPHQNPAEPQAEPWADFYRSPGTQTADDGFGHFDPHIPSRPPETMGGPAGSPKGEGSGMFGPIDGQQHRHQQHPKAGENTGKRPPKPREGGDASVWLTGPTNESMREHSCANFTRRKDYASVVCTPVPNAFNPCEDVMGYEWLRVIVWFVLLATICGNLVVIVVLVTGRGKMTVPKFLMCNLSFADLLMGLYLLLLASIDVHSLGEYFTHAVSWQNDGGCQVAGFLTVFSSELSVFVLMVITLERWYAISYAIHLTKRLRIRQAWALMLTGWLYASTMALLPLVGVSGYGAVSMCLPMEAKDVGDKVYIVGLLLLNGLAFLVICCCYVSMFLKVRSSDTTARSNDATIAKRMSILVLTNFACWAPIAFFGLTASFGFPMIDISNSKILLVFFYPLNSCANPFLYVILTKQFRKDVLILLARRGICTKRANEYKGTNTNKSHSNSRNNGMMLKSAQHLSDMSMLSRLSIKSSRCSFNGATPKTTPQASPHTTPPSSPKASPLRRLIGVATSSLMSHPGASSGGGWSPVASSENGAKASSSSSSSNNVPGKERKLSVVPESSQASDEGSNSHEERVLEGRDSLRDFFDGKPHGRVRSASEYVVLYPPRDKAGEPVSREGRTYRPCHWDKQSSLETSISSATETSYISDSSWTRLDSFSSENSQAQAQGQESEWPSTAKVAAMTASKRASEDDPRNDNPGISPALPRMRVRFIPARLRTPAKSESLSKPLAAHSQLVRLMQGQDGSQEDRCSVGRDSDDLLDDDSKVRQSLL